MGKGAMLGSSGDVINMSFKGEVAEVLNGFGDGFWSNDDHIRFVIA